MRCPRDGQKLETETFCGVIIDSCSYCDGTWLDKGELGKIVGVKKDILGGEPVKPGDLKDRPPGQSLLCPRCGDVEMDPLYYSGKKKIIIDKCPACKGIWLDTEELKFIIKTAYEAGVGYN